MGEALDLFSKALAGGASRRATLGGLLASWAATLPWSAEAKKHKRKKKRKRKQKRNKQFLKFLDVCTDWCELVFGVGNPEIDKCVALAKEGKGACFSATEQGPGFFCTQVKQCGDLNCCPDLNGGGPVTDGDCCVTECQNLNGTLFCLD